MGLSLKWTRAGRLLMGRQHRSYSSAPSPPYSSKVRAFPFAFPPSEAENRLSIHAAVTSETWGHVAPAPLCLIASGILPYLPVEPIQAVYWPAWIIDSEIRALATVSYPHYKREQPLSVPMMHSYMPGHHLDPLFRVCLNTPHWIGEKQLVKWDEDLSRQYNTDVRCLPYTLTPLSVPDAVRRLHADDAVVDKRLRFDPSTMNVKYLAAYPILFPLYMAKYQHAKTEEHFTLMIPAHNLSDGIYVMSNLQQNTDGPFYRWHQEQFMPQDIHPGIQLLGAREIDQFVIKGMSGIRVTDRAEVRTAIIAWASQFVRTRWAPDAQPPARVARDMLDARVRDYDEKERTETQIWMGQGMEIDDIVMGIHDRQEYLHDLVRPTSRVPQRELGLRHYETHMLPSVLQHVKRLIAVRNATAPQWWRTFARGQPQPRVDANDTLIPVRKIV